MRSGRFAWMALGLVVAASPSLGQERPRKAIPLVDRMPARPEPFRIVDWKVRALGFDRLVFDEGRTGPYLPVVRLVPEPRVVAPPGFALPSYLGDDRDHGEGICALAALMNGTLMGVDRSREGGRNWVAMGREWFNPDPRVRIVGNNPGSGGSGSYWYDLLPGALFAQLATRYPEVPGMRESFRAMADRYRALVEARGGPSADFEQTGYDFARDRPIDNGRWREPDAAAGIAFIEHLAYQTWHDPRHLEAARWCLDALDRRPADRGNPLYEVLLDYAPALAARFNAEHGTDYDVEKLLNWCLSENQGPRATRPGWGVVASRFGAVEAHGLVGQTHPGDRYVFAMNTFHAAGCLAPLVRYDERYAQALGKWLMNVANNARLFYPDGLPADQQSPPRWPEGEPPVIPYEGLREKGRHRGEWLGETTAKGTASGDLRERRPSRRAEVLTPDENDGGLDHVWEFRAPTGITAAGCWLRLESGAKVGAFRLSVRPSESAPWTPAGSFPRDGDRPGEPSPVGLALGSVRDGARFAVRVESARAGESAPPLTVRDLRCEFAAGETPYATGDPLFFAWGAPTDFGVYGGAFVGYLAALVERTDREHVLRFDLRATDFAAGPGLPSYLYYNGDPEDRLVTAEVGPKSQDLYDTVTKRWLAQGAVGRARFRVPAEGAVVLVVVPSDAPIRRDGGRLLAGDLVIDWHP